MNLKGRNFLTLKDFTPEEIQYLLEPLIWIQLVPRSAKKRALQILQEFLDGCMRASSTVDMVRPS